MNKTPKIRVGVIGTGRIGKLHIEHIAQGIPEAESRGTLQSGPSEYG